MTLGSAVRGSLPLAGLCPAVCRCSARGGPQAGAEENSSVVVSLFLPWSITGLSSGEEGGSCCTERCGPPARGSGSPTLLAPQRGFTFCFPVEIPIVIFQTVSFGFSCHLCWEFLYFISLKPVLSCLVFQT